MLISQYLRDLIINIHFKQYPSKKSNIDPTHFFIRYGRRDKQLIEECLHPCKLSPKDSVSICMDYANKYNDNVFMGWMLPSAIIWDETIEGSMFWGALYRRMYGNSSKITHRNYWVNFSEKDHMQWLLDSDHKIFIYPEQ